MKIMFSLLSMAAVMSALTIAQNLPPSSESSTISPPGLPANSDSSNISPVGPLATEVSTTGSQLGLAANKVSTAASPAGLSAAGQSGQSGSCASVTCLNGEICKEEVNPVTGVASGRCVAGAQPLTKPGSCPRPVGLSDCTSNCKSDSDCLGNQKCCPNSCFVSTCQTPGLPTPVIAGPPEPVCLPSCQPGYRCALKPVQCPFFPCPSTPTCVPGQPGQPGQPIPPRQPIQPGQPTQPGQPIQPGQSGQQPKSGTCPSNSLNTDSSLCTTECQSDADCLGTKKCCSGARCGATCQEPAAENTCTILHCPGGSTIVQKTIPCLIAPCDTTAECVRNA